VAPGLTKNSAVTLRVQFFGLLLGSAMLLLEFSTGQNPKQQFECFVPIRTKELSW
jgi:hypothetical protein